MLKISEYEVMGFRLAIKGMRNAFKSWSKSDSYMEYPKPDGFENCANCRCGEPPKFIIGENDMNLCKGLIMAGSSDRKFLRMIHVQANVTAPLYWWKEYDTYKVGTTANSESTMHTIHKEEFKLSDFSTDHLCDEQSTANVNSPLNVMEHTVSCLNYYRRLFLSDKKDKKSWWNMIQLLPSSYNQMRTIDLDYETLMSIHSQRKNHKLDEWRNFCSWIESLPYMRQFIGFKEEIRNGK